MGTPANTREPNDAVRLPGLSALTAEHIATAARAAGEPEWLVTRRIEAWNFFAQAAPPQWRRTNLADLEPEAISPVLARQGTTLQVPPDGAATLAAQGVIFTTLADAVQRHGDLVQARMATAVAPLSHKFSALRAALWQDGVFLYLPKQAEVEVPLHVRYTLPTGSRAFFPYSLIILEPGARVTFSEDFASANAHERVLVGPTTEIFAGAGSAVRYISVQRWGAKVYHIGGQVLALDRDASGEWVSMALGATVQHVEAEARMQGDGSRIDWKGATFANGEQNLVTAPWLRHIATSTESHMDFKTVVTDRGYSVFDGMIKIEHGSRSTATRLEEHAVHLSPASRSDSIPGLKIDTNDVARAGHASTSGQVDEEMLFYMQSRGIPKAEALRLIVMGFFEPALNAIPQEEWREELAAAIEAKI